MRWDNFSEKNSSVIRASGWLPIDDCQRHLEGRSGVYIFARDDQWVEYVGSTGMMFEGVRSAIRQEKGLGSTLVKALYTISRSEADALARNLVSEYRPRRN